MLPINELLHNPDEQKRLVESLEELFASRQAVIGQLLEAGDIEKLSCLQKEIVSDINCLTRELMTIRKAIFNVSNVRQYTLIEDE